MIIDIQTQAWYAQLVEDCKDIAVETEFTSRWALVEGRHLLGSRILQEYDNFQRLRMPDSELVKCVSLSIKRNKRTVYYAVQFARKFPNLNLLPEGKDTNWHRIINKYLTDGMEKKSVKKADLSRMIKEIKELLETEWLKVHQEENRTDFILAPNIDNTKYREYQHLQGEYIRYLQDQVNKITGGLEL